jgi:hypothetical protein
MPVVRNYNQPPPLLREQLIARLADELAAPGGPGGEPLVFENPIPGADKFFAIVVWSEWRSVPWGQRSPIIRDAYRRHDELHPEAPRAPQLALSTGMSRSWPSPPG